MCRRRLAATSIALAALAVTTASAAGAATAPRFPYCSWWLETTPQSANFALPDTSAAYWTTPFVAQPGLKITVKGEFPDARFMSLTVYDNTFGTFSRNGVQSSLTDYQIKPDAGTVNPYQRLTGHPGRFTISIQRFVSSRGRNVLPLVPQRQLPSGLLAGSGLPPNVGFIIYRTYLAHDGFGSVALPTLAFSRHGRTATLPTCPWRAAGAPGPGGSGPAAKAAARLESLIAGRSGATTTVADPTGSLAFARPPAGTTNSYFPNDANAYVASVFPPTSGTVTVVQGKAPTHTPGNVSLPWPNSAYDLRYWSLCNNVYAKPDPVVVVSDPATGEPIYGCAADLDTTLVGGEYTYALSAVSERPPNATSVNGVTWLPYSDPSQAGSADDVLVFRNMLGDGFANSVQNVPPGGGAAATQSVMGPYYPRIAQCSLSTFTQGGASACFAAAGG